MRIPFPPHRLPSFRFCWILTQRGKAHADSLRRLRFVLEDMLAELDLYDPTETGGTNGNANDLHLRPLRSGGKRI